MNARVYVTASFMSVAAAVLGFLACGSPTSQDQNIVADAGLLSSDGAFASLPTCDAVGDAFTMTANGLDTRVIRIAGAGWINSDGEPVDVRISSLDQLVTLSTNAAPGEAGASTASSVVATLSEASPNVDIVVRAGLNQGLAHLEFSVGTKQPSVEYCLELKATQVETIALALAPPSASASAWSNVQLTATLQSADGTPISNNTPADWDAGACPYLAANRTFTSSAEGGTMSNTLYLPPGWTHSEVTVVSGNAGKTVCLTPAGAAAPSMSDGGCSDLVFDAGPPDGSTNQPSYPCSL